MSRAGQVKSTTRTLLERKVPLNTILLPPISPELQEKGIEILRNVLVSSELEFTIITIIIIYCK